MMMGRRTDQETLFYEFRLAERVPPDHLLRRVDAVLDLSWVRGHMAAHYSATGRPSICPELMIRMLLVGYLFGVRSERRLCEEVDLNLAYRWFCRLGLNGKVPDHSTFTKNRHGRFRDSGLMRAVFERIVDQCLATGLARVEHVAVDGTFVQADASYGRAVVNVEALPREDAPRAVRDYLADLESAAPDPEGVMRSWPKRVSLTDPAAALSRKHGPATFAYGMNAMLDTGSDIVLEVQAAPERFADEPIAARRMVERLHARCGMKPSVLTADKAYGTGPFLAELEAVHEIEAHIPLIDRRHQTKGKLTQDAFRYDHGKDAYVCPQGAQLQRYGPNDAAQRYRASPRDCGPCTIKASCTSGKARAICRSPHEEIRERVRTRQNASAFHRSMRLQTGRATVRLRQAPRGPASASPARTAGC